MKLKEKAKTNHELILRLRNSQDNEAWSEFVTLYEPMIRRIAVKLGMSPENASDASQDVLLQLSQVVVKWNPQSHVGSFRSWLHQVARNAMIRILQKKSLHICGSGRTDVHQFLAEQPDRNLQESRYFDSEFRQQVFAFVLKKIESEFRPSTWRAFWLSTIEQHPIFDVAAELKISVGSVYISRSRVMKRVKAEVKRLADDQWDSIVGLNRNGDESRDADSSEGPDKAKNN